MENYPFFGKSFLKMKLNYPIETARILLEIQANFNKISTQENKFLLTFTLKRITFIIFLFRLY